MIIAVFSLLIIVAITMLITRLAAMALVLTGMSHESAQFQARSALAGVGFTTREAESVVCHPVRRRIIMLLMMAGSISVPTVIAALGVSLFTTFQAERWWWPLLLLLAGLLALGLFGKSRWMNKRVNTVLAWGLKNCTDLDVRDYGSLLQLQNGFAVTEMLIKHGDWLEQKTLQQAALSHEGVLVLGIQRIDGVYVGTPRAADTIQAGDTLVLYGQIQLLKKLDQRQAAFGDYAHEEATVEHTAEAARGELANRSLHDVGD
ncbi:MAG: TrkA C-terminal domain-containing protein [Kiritimatiellae bacterium]|nr:TrkA C-terminal domain-containing protein [Kiritimatiellia bacterium]